MKRPVGSRILLREEYLTGAAIPSPCPWLVRPADQEGKIGLPRADDFRERALQQPLSTEPVVVVAERVDPVGTSQLCLCLAHVAVSQVVVPQFTRAKRLAMAAKLRCGGRDAIPL